jgi:hypothetical protein
MTSDVTHYFISSFEGINEKEDIRFAELIDFGKNEKSASQD